MKSTWEVQPMLSADTFFGLNDVPISSFINKNHRNYIHFDLKTN